MKLKMITFLVGDSGCGKSTLQKNLKIDNTIPWILSSTIRQKRKGEQDNVDYRFVTDYRYAEEKRLGLVVQDLTFGGNTYYTILNSYEIIEYPIATIAVLPGQIEVIKNYFAQAEIPMNYCTVLFDVSKDQIIKNLGGDSITDKDRERVARGNLTADFYKLKLDADLIVKDELFLSSDFNQKAFNAIATKFTVHLHPQLHFEGF